MSCEYNTSVRHRSVATVSTSLSSLLVSNTARFARHSLQRSSQTFSCEELITFDGFCLLTVILNTLNMSRVDLKKDIIDGPEIRGALREGFGKQAREGELRHLPPSHEEHSKLTRLLRSRSLRSSQYARPFTPASTPPISRPSSRSSPSSRVQDTCPSTSLLSSVN